MDAAAHTAPRDINEWWLLRCLEEAVRDIDRMTAEMSTDFDALSEAFQRKAHALWRLGEIRKSTERGVG